MTDIEIRHALRSGKYKIFFYNGPEDFFDIHDTESRYYLTFANGESMEGYWTLIDDEIFREYKRKMKTNKHIARGHYIADCMKYGREDLYSIYVGDDEDFN